MLSAMKLLLHRAEFGTFERHGEPAAQLSQVNGKPWAVLIIARLARAHSLASDWRMVGTENVYAKTFLLYK